MTNIEASDQIIELAGYMMAGSQLHDQTASTFFRQDNNGEIKTDAFGAVMAIRIANLDDYLDSQLRCYDWICARFPVIIETLPNFEDSIRALVWHLNDEKGCPREFIAEFLIKKALELRGIPMALG